MATSETTEADTVPYEGSELLDYRKLSREIDIAGNPSQGRKLLQLDIAALLDAAFADDASVKECFRTALLHYRLAAQEVLGMEVICDETAVSAAVSRKNTDPAGPPPPELQPGDLMPVSARPQNPESATVIAIIDEGLPFAQPQMGAHLASVWMMAAARRGAVLFGAEITGIDLAQPQTAHDRLCGASGRYRALDVDDVRSPSGRRMRGLRTHGSSVMAIAVEDLGSEHPVIGVGFPAEVVRDTSGAVLPFFILLGVVHVVARTRALSYELGKSRDLDPLALPAVINISYGVLSGPKDGSDPLSHALDALCDPARQPIEGLGPVHVVWPMGNGRQAQSHARVGSQTGPLSLHLLPDDRTPSYVSLRADVPEDGSFALRAALCLPGDTEWTETTRNPIRGTRMKLQLRDGSIVYAYFKRETPAHGRPRDLIILAFGPTVRWDYRDRSMPVGRWGLKAEAFGEVEVFVQRDDSLVEMRSGGRQARLGHASYTRQTAAGREIEFDEDGPSSPIQRIRSFNAYASGNYVWRVGGRTGREERMVSYSGLGTPGDPTRPVEGDVLAVSDRSLTIAGVPVRAFFGGTSIRETGTSVAAPWIARGMVEAMTDYRAKYGSWPGRSELTYALEQRAFRPDPQA
ncbi:hypothetical protein [Pontivivens ytuae]|uniref:Peptidase S8/S53 domain-containing protein n=1 Tax=Pontivivens ytuae TaxID=2789856 RepID=A0A7S9LSN6_9RHOB|nr:hypothetical protein [Pontivivens ytuae]QPH54507.1 hypothetical protein I0K15_01625 [Pontivivens ytuae]